MGIALGMNAGPLMTCFIYAVPPRHPLRRHVLRPQRLPPEKRSRATSPPSLIIADVIVVGLPLAMTLFRTYGAGRLEPVPVLPQKKAEQ